MPPPTTTPSDDMSYNKRCISIRTALLVAVSFFFGLQLNVTKNLFGSTATSGTSADDWKTQLLLLHSPPNDNNIDIHKMETGNSSSSPAAKLSPNSRKSDSNNNVTVNDRRFVPRTNLPYDCGKSITDPVVQRMHIPHSLKSNTYLGVVFFFHIPSTGGASINKWFKKSAEEFPQLDEVDDDNLNGTYFQHWKLAKLKGK